MSRELRVRTAHLGELAAEHDAAAAALSSVAEDAGGVGSALGASHGPIAAATAAAVTAVLQRRLEAGTRAAAQSSGLHDNLEASAAAYRATDETAAETLGTGIES